MHRYSAVVFLRTNATAAGLYNNRAVVFIKIGDYCASVFNYNRTVVYNLAVRERRVFPVAGIGRPVASESAIFIKGHGNALVYGKHRILIIL